jgi:hypothetical protein
VHIGRDFLAHIQTFGSVPLASALFFMISDVNMLTDKVSLQILTRNNTVSTQFFLFKTLISLQHDADLTTQNRIRTHLGTLKSFRKMFHYPRYNFSVTTSTAAVAISITTFHRKLTLQTQNMLLQKSRVII